MIENTGYQWQEKGGDTSAHTLTVPQADRLAPAYLAFMRSEFQHVPKTGLDIGAGAGNLAAAFNALGVQMTASEWHPSGLALIRRGHPYLPLRAIDLHTFNDAPAWDFVICRVLYPFARVDDFETQWDMVSRIVDSLNPGGLFVLSHSDATAPDTLDRARLYAALRSDARIKRFGVWLEPVILRVRFGYSLASWAAGKIHPIFRSLPPFLAVVVQRH